MNFPGREAFIAATRGSGSCLSQWIYGNRPAVALYEALQQCFQHRCGSGLEANSALALQFTGHWFNQHDDSISALQRFDLLG